MIDIWDGSDSTRLYELYQATVGADKYGLPRETFDRLVRAKRARVFTHPSGFALTYLIRAGSESCESMQYDKGSLALLCVEKDARGQGVGTALHDTAMEYLETKVKSSLTQTGSEIQLGSIFPRIFPGVPAELSEAAAWFKRRGWDVKEEESIDLYRKIGDSPDCASKALSLGWTFRVPTEQDDEALFALQEKEFGRFTGWPDVFPLLLASTREDVWCAYDPSGTLQGATVAAMPGSKIHDMLAWPDILGKCGVIACVGVSSSSQGSGAGIALVATALDHLKQRGADGCFIDWVSMKGFYEKCGFEKWAGYREAWRRVDL